MDILDGIQILELGHMIPPAAAYMLGDMGASVIKIEDPVRGDLFRGMSQLYGDAMDWASNRHVGMETVARNKRSLTLDLKKEAGQRILTELVKKTDIFLTNFDDAVCKRLGTDYETLKRLNPKLIWARATNYGPKGPLANRRGYDPTAQARSGLMWSIGERDIPEPLQTGSAMCDTTAATMLAYGCLAALVARERHGIGQKVEASLLGSMIHIQSQALMVTSLRGRAWARHSRLRVKNPLTNHYKCADSKWILLAEAQITRFWPIVCQALGVPDLCKDPKFAAAPGGVREHSAEVIKILDAIFITKSRDEWIKTFEEQKAKFAYSPVFNYYEVLQDPQALVNDYIVELDHPLGKRVKFVGYPVQFSETPCFIRSVAPEHGQHTEEILIDYLGYTWEEIENLRKDAVI